MTFRGPYEFDEFDDPLDSDDEPVPCSVCSCLIGDEVGYGDTWDGVWVCENCVNGFESWSEIKEKGRDVLPKKS